MKTFYIGRNPDNDIVYNEGQVSGRHAEITVGDDGQIVFADYSTNGSYVNGVLVHHASQPIAYGDEIIFPGNIRFDWNMIMEMPQIQPQPANGGYDNWNGNAGGGGFAAQSTIHEQYGYNGGFDGGIPMEPSPSGTLSFSLSFSDGFASGLRNALRLFAIILLAILTCWIPYINVGVFIALTTLPAQWAKDEPVNPLSIFDRRYRLPMGNFLLSQLLVNATICLGMAFMFVPGLVICYSWYLTSLFIVENGMNPLEATNASNRCTYGSKWTIFAVQLVYFLCYVVGIALLVGLVNLTFNSLDTFNGAAVYVLSIIFAIVFIIFVTIAASVGIGLNGSIWRQLKDRAM